MRRVKLIMRRPPLTEGLGYYRSIIPFTDLRTRVDWLDVQLLDDITPHDIRNCDVLFMLRPSSDRPMEQLKQARLYGKKVWVDYDDNLFLVPKDNPMSESYDNPQVQKNIGFCMSKADAFTTSTESLADQLAPVVKRRPMVVPNAFHESTIQARSPKEKRQNVVFWRGTATHERDIFSIADKMVDVAQDNPDLCWAFLGYNPWFLLGKNWFIEKRITNLSYFSPLAFDLYMDVIQEVAAKVFVVPLYDCHFNRAKSNIAAMEASFTGAHVLAPNWDEWKLPGVYNYGSREEFAERLQEIVSKPDNSRLDQTWAHIRENLSLAKINDRRVKILEGML